MRRRLWLLGFVALGWALGCVAASSSAILEQPEQVVVSAVEGPCCCDSAACLLAQAEADRRAGVEDRATVLLGRAYALAPTDEAFSIWVGELLRTGQHRRAARALEQARREGLHADLVAKFEAQREHQRERPFEPIVALGDLAWSRGDLRAAREAWSRARIELDERGAQLRLAERYRWSPTSLAWVGDRLELRDRALLDTDTGELDLSVARSLELEHAEVISEGPLAIAATTTSSSMTLAVGPANDRHHLIVSQRRVELHSGDGTLREQHELDGTFVQHGEICTGTETIQTTHEYDVDVVAAAVSDDLRDLAIAGSDGSIRLQDRQSGRTRELWLESRKAQLLHESPPRNVALALHVDGGDLWAVSSYGEFLRWRLRDGARLERRESSRTAVSPARFSPTGTYAAARTRSGGGFGLCIWTPQLDAIHLHAPALDPSALAFADDDRLAILDSDGQLWLWSADAGLRSIGPGRERVELPAAALRLSADGRYLHSPHHSWDLATRAPSRDEQLLGHEISVAANIQARLVADGQFGEQRLEVRTLDTNALLFSKPTAEAREIALAPNGTILAWISGDTVKSVALDEQDSAARVLHLAHGGGALAISPSGDELAIASGPGLLRWRPQADEQRFDPWPTGIHAASWMRYSADGNHLIASQSELLHVLSSTLEIEATVELLHDEHWLVTTPSGSVDGSPGVHLQLLSIVEESGRSVAHGGSLAWDRFEVPNLLARVLAGERAAPVL